MYESKEIALIEKHLPLNAEVLELGASLGVVSSFILGRSPSKFVSYEAVPEMAERARGVVSHNHPHSSWEMVNAAVVATGSGTVEFHWSAEGSDAGSLVSGASHGRILVPAVTLDHALMTHGFRPGAWLVMDIEGAEHDILRHSSKAMRGLGGVILESHEQGPHAAEEAFERVGDMGFTMVGRRGRVAAFARREASS